MKRSINEKKALEAIFMGFVLNYISLFVFGWSIRKPTIILGTISISLYFIGIMFLCSGFYSLGWEYKRMENEK